MCGIAGYFSLRPPIPGSEFLRDMVSQIAHRGPDGQGYYTNGPVGLGHARLAILDLTDAGTQPMQNEDGTVWITYNGEIYNFVELRERLEEVGHTFHSSTDTEVIIHAYEEWGTDCVNRFCGMFSFALWDGVRRRLWLVRDRLGIKPLFYALLPDVFLFASEIKAILTYPGFERAIDYSALSYFLSLNYTPAPHTLFKEIRQVNPACSLIVTEDGRCKESEYWDIPYREDVFKSERQWVDEFEHLFHRVVSDHLASDVPFGAFLSGGLDSSSIVHVMSKHLDFPVKTFTIGFGERSYDESMFANEVARSLDTDHHVGILQPNIEEILPEIVWHAEEPTADSSMVALYQLARETRGHVPMVLSGDGADEILAGYETYQAYYMLRAYHLIPRSFRKIMSDRLLRVLPVTGNKVGWDQKARRFLYGAQYSSEDAHALWRIIFNKESREQLLKPVSGQPGINVDSVDLCREYFNRCKGHHPLNRMLYVDTKFYLPNDMLVKVDRMTMAHGLEARVPFLDHRLVEFAASVPPHLKLRYFYQKKYLLKKAMQGKLPKSILRRRKAGFNVPKASWLKNDLKSFVTDCLSESTLREIGLFDISFVQKLVEQHFNKKADNSFQIWGVLSLVLWWNRFQKKGMTI